MQHIAYIFVTQFNTILLSIANVRSLRFINLTLFLALFCITLILVISMYNTNYTILSAGSTVLHLTRQTGLTPKVFEIVNNVMLIIGKLFIITYLFLLLSEY